jgi:UDP-N-acetylglucosamine acyltransferase
MAGSHVAHDCKVGNHVVMANNAVLGGHASVGDNSFLGGQAAVRQFVRIGEGAMIVGLSGIRADIIPWGMAQGPLANLVGLNVVGLRRRGFAKADIHRLRMAYKDLFLGGGVFRDRLAQVERAYAGVPLIDSVFAFIRGGKRPLSTAIRRGSDDATQDQ